LKTVALGNLFPNDHVITFVI